MEVVPFRLNCVHIGKFERVTGKAVMRGEEKENGGEGVFVKNAEQNLWSKPSTMPNIAYSLPIGCTSTTIVTRRPEPHQHRIIGWQEQNALALHSASKLYIHTFCKVFQREFRQ